MRIHTILQSGVLYATLASTISTAVWATRTSAAERPTLREMSITTFDFRFEAPDTVPAGLTRIRLRNEGKDFHHVQLVRLGDRTTIPALLAAIAKPMEPLPAGTRYVGGPNVPPNGATSEATLTLEPGRYALICFVAGEDHVSHMNKGMTRLLTVVPTLETSSAHPKHPEPKADARMVLRDYAFDITPVIRAGRRTIRVETATDQPHEAVLGRLAPGKTLGDLMQWMAKREGPMPGEQIGGVTALSRGEVNYITADFTPGEYILLCFVRDANDGKPHIAHGMARQFTVHADAPTTTSSQVSWSGVSTSSARTFLTEIETP